MNVNGEIEKKQTLPTGWRWVNIGAVCKLTNGNAYRDTDWSKEGIPIIRIQNLNDERKLFNYWNGTIDDKVNVKSGDVLLAWSGTPGTSFGAHLWTRGGAVLNQHIFLIEFDSNMLDARWLVFAINQQLENMIFSAHGGVGLRHVKKAEVENLKILLPPLAEQKRIAAILNEQMEAIDKARAAAEAQLAAAESLPTAYLREVFPKEGAALPPGWRWIKLGELCDIKARQVDPKLIEYSGFLHVSAEDIESGTGRMFKLQSAAEDGMISGKYLFEKGSILYSKIRPYLRKVALASFQGVCSADMYPLNANEEMLDSHFFVWLLLSQSFTEYADAESRRARMPKLNRDQLFSYIAAIPPINEQKHIAAILSEHFAAAELLRINLEKQLDEINALPASLLRRAFSGEL